MGTTYTGWVLVYLLMVMITVLVVLLIGRTHNLQLIRDLEKAKVESKRYIEDLDNLLSMLTHFQEIGMNYTKTNNIQKMCDLIIEYATDLLETKMGSLMLINKSTNMLEIVSARGLSDEVVKSTKLYIGEGIAGRVTQEGKAIYCEDVDSDVRFLRHSKVQYDSKSFIAVPLKVKNKIIGVLNINSKTKEKKFSPRDLKLTKILADQAAIAIENMQLYNGMKEVYLGTIKTLAEAIEAKDPSTRGHTERVTKFAVEIAKEMDLPSNLVTNIEFAALIHDIGKIGIKDDVLLKPGQLSKSEYESIKKHPLIGEQILAPVEFLTNVAPLVLYHHEHYNGEGYMEGLKGEEIPVGARVLNVADSYEAMIAERPYSKSMTQKDAIQELRNNAGTQFDPKIVEAFLRVLEKKKLRVTDRNDMQSKQQNKVL